MVGCDFGRGDESPLLGTAPDFEVESLSSGVQKATLVGLHGKPVLIDFWATWCGPCKMLSPYVESVYDKYKGQGLEGMAISDEDRKLVKRFEKSNPHRMPVYLDPNDIANRTFQVQALPTVAVVDRNGRILYLNTGYDPVDTMGEVKRLDDAVAKAVKS